MAPKSSRDYLTYWLKLKSLITTEDCDGSHRDTIMSSGEPPEQTQKIITPEALALSASLFTSSIDSWVPKDFGVVKSDDEKRREFEGAFTKPIRGFESSDR